MTKRLQVRIDDDELRSIQRLAREEGLSTSEWVRRRLREAHAVRTRRRVARKLAAIHEASQVRAPAPPIEQMLAEIDQRSLDSGTEPDAIDL